jgi:hypothetical protein
MTKPFKFPSHLMVFVCSPRRPLLNHGPLRHTAPAIASNPNAINLKSQTLQSLSGGTALIDITIQANAN